MQNVDLSVLILTPEVSFDEFTSLYRVPDEINFKLIPCDELSDVSHVLKQLKSDLVFLPNDFDYCKGLSIYIQGEFINFVKIFTYSIESKLIQIHRIYWGYRSFGFQPQTRDSLFYSRIILNKHQIY